MNKTKIEWCDMTWNPVTGCYHKCPYCYASKVATRFWPKPVCDQNYDSLSRIQKTEYPIYTAHESNPSYPLGFIPTFHPFRLKEPSEIKKPQNIFVCSMADLFGDWVPDEWIEKVFDACLEAPQHRYLFLTKSPNRYYDFIQHWEAPENFYFGTTVVNDTQDFYWSESNNTFLSIEPLQSKYLITQKPNQFVNWAIIGRETGNRKDKIIPKKEWIANIVNYCKEKNVPIFMKNNLKDIWQETLIQEFPWRGENWGYEDINNFVDDILNNDYIVCYKCKSSLSFNNFQKDTIDYRCTNKQCNDVGRIDISRDAIIKLLEQL